MVLTKEIIKRDLKADNDFWITPLLSEEQFQPASLDVRLGKEFIIFKKSRKQCIDLTLVDSKLNNKLIHEFQERIRLSINSPFTLHPGELILASTLEYLSLPNNIFASVEGKSTLGRLGLIIATATAVSPGFKGCITLEIVNQGEIPVVVSPGQLIGQIIFMRTEGTATYRGRYHYPVGPQFPKI
ncbi:dCTP deaminase [Paraglaciecola sp. T6c]|uniref:dCTP deaminase n=1 Tax=Pseudoalteromonas atlantica (strain T6c / ATCC BAA-1087) TaxID=3042615 RepID=UPI00005C6CCF|nr:dCTP deaminase [Paraglaciecola sp. T6c]ABG38858.1 dCTP deaminase [Paraglaciecola sp. T6c]